MKIILTVFAALAALALTAQRQPYDRYQSIVDRQMFGEPPPGFDPTKSPSEVSRSSGRGAAAEELTQEQQQIKSAIHFSVINVTPGGETAVGFTDNCDAKNPVHYYLKVGETRNGWTVKEADPVKATMTIAKGEIEVSLAIGDNSAKGGGKNAARGEAAKESADRRPGSLLGSSLRNRRLLREQRAQQQEEEAKKRQEERDRQAAEEREQREQERAEQKAQLLQIQEELRRQREERATQANPSAESSGNGGGAGNDS
jgi:hypothetical protein